MAEEWNYKSEFVELSQDNESTFSTEAPENQNEETENEPTDLTNQDKIQEVHEAESTKTIHRENEYLTIKVQELKTEHEQDIKQVVRSQVITFFCLLFFVIFFPVL